MRYKVLMSVFLLIISVNILFTIEPIQELLRLTKYALQYNKDERTYEVERYNGYDNIVQFVKTGDNLPGNTVIISALDHYATQFSTFYNLSYLSKNKVFYAPFQIAMNRAFFDNTYSKKMIILTKNRATAFYGDSIFEKNAFPLQSYIVNDSLILIWQYPPHREMRLYISDKEGRVFYSTPLPADILGSSTNEIKLPVKSLNIYKNNTYYWTVSCMEHSKFLQFTGKFRYD